MAKEEFFDIEIVDILKVKPYFNNAKRHLSKEINTSIRAFKLDQPIVVDKNFVIIKGHGRYEEMIKIGYKTIPVIVRNDLNNEQVMAARLADNRSAEGGHDYDKLNSELKQLAAIKLDFSLKDLGLDQTWLDSNFNPKLNKKIKENILHNNDIKNITQNNE